MTLPLFNDDGERAFARRSDPPTSHEAAGSLPSDKLRASQQAVLTILRTHGPACDTDLVRLYQRLSAGGRYPQQSESGIRTRRKELVAKGLVVDTGRRTLTVSGRRTVVWAVA